MSAPTHTLVTRRRLLLRGPSAALTSAVGGNRRALYQSGANRPLITHGLQSGDVSIDSGVVWARADRPSRMLVEVATTDSFKDIRRSL